MYTPKAATPATAELNRRAAQRYDLEDRQDFADADRGLIAGIPDAKVLRADGSVLFDLARFDYLTDNAPAA
jgi:alkyl sulfatase BDS1-like metallo-beta-lactamase superfamily hydrolase